MITYRFVLKVRTSRGAQLDLQSDLVKYVTAADGVDFTYVAHPAVRDVVSIAFKVPDTHDLTIDDMTYELSRIDGVLSAWLYGMQADLAPVPFLKAAQGLMEVEHGT